MTEPTEQTETELKSFRIVSLQASNIKKLSAVLIKPDRNVVTLAGENGAGKSSVLDAIEYALAGKSAICEQPIRRGATKGEIVCKLNGLVVTRRFTASGTTLQVAADGEGTRKSPQAILDELVGNLAFDPLSFARMEGKAQLETMRKLVGIDFAKENAEREKLYEERKNMNRDFANAKARLDGLSFDESAPAEEVSVESLIQEMESAEKVNVANGIERRKIDFLTSRVNHISATQLSIEQQIAELQDRLAQCKIEHENAVRDVAAQGEVCAALQDVDTSALRTKINAVSAQNRVVAANRHYRAVESEMESANTKAAELTARLEAIDEAKRARLAAAKFPLPELSFDDGHVLFNGTPFSQASKGEQLRVSVAVGMALNPKLRVIFIRDGSLLTENGIKIVSDLAREKDFQIWIEDSRSTDPTAVLIEDGHVAMKGGQPSAVSTQPEPIAES